MIAILAGSVLKVAAVIYASDTFSMQMCGRAGCGESCVVARRKTSRLNVGELKCNYQAITAAGRLGRKESYSFFSFFFRSINLIPINAVP